MILLDSILSISETLKNFAEAIAILIGGGWAYYKFILQRERYSKTELDLDFKILGVQNGFYIVELAVNCHNKGSVREYIDDFTFNLLLLSDDTNIAKGDERILNQLQFKKHISKQNWIPDKWGYTFFDPGIPLHYSHVTCLPLNTTFVLLQTRFFVKEKKTDFIAAQEVFAIKI